MSYVQNESFIVHVVVTLSPLTDMLVNVCQPQKPWLYVQGASAAKEKQKTVHGHSTKLILAALPLKQRLGKIVFTLGCTSKREAQT